MEGTKNEINMTWFISNVPSFVVNAVSLKRYILCYFSSVIVQDTDSKKKADMFQKKIFCLNNVTEIKIFCLNNVTEIKINKRFLEKCTLSLKEAFFFPIWFQFRFCKIN